MEFGAKKDVSIDEKGYARLEKVSFNLCNESTIFWEVIERYRKRTWCYPEQVLADQIYQMRKTLRYCKERGIRMSESKFGHPAKDGCHDGMAEKDNRDQFERGHFLSVEKRCYGEGLINRGLMNRHYILSGKQVIESEE